MGFEWDSVCGLLGYGHTLAVSARVLDNATESEFTYRHVFHLWGCLG